MVRLDENSGMNIIPVFKPAGVESSAIVEIYKTQFPGELVMHAGALDPLAEGLMLIVIGTNKHSDILELIGVPKSYDFEILLGFTTDTWDVLGINKSVSIPFALNSGFVEKVEKFIQGYQGKVSQRVPVFSNMRFRNKRMHQWAREGLSHMVPPMFRDREIYTISYQGHSEVNASDLGYRIGQKVNNVQGDFRQQEILSSWKNTFVHLPADRQFPIIKCSISCESGTYVRSIAYALGNELGCGGVSWHIMRTKIGEYSIDDVKEIGTLKNAPIY